MRSRGLGRGLSALIGDTDKENERLSEVLISDIFPNSSQPRTDFKLEELEELQNSIAQNGVLQPILIRPVDFGKYKLIAGERRWRASKALGLAYIPAIIKNADELKSLELALIENVQREDLSALEEAESYSKLIKEYGYSQEKLGTVVSKSRSHIGNLIRLLSLPDGVKKHLKDGSINVGHAKLLMNVPNAEEIADQIIKNDLNVRETEQLIKSTKQNSRIPKPSGKKYIQHMGDDYDLLAIEKALNASLGGQIKVKVDCHNDGAKVSLFCDGLEELDLIIRKLTGSIK
ncbi:MAG: ParB/RepB/Spo0J family partition protein [Rickettsiales bacterium]|jgi:ParB family chromosome partitioning protein|nr:ParB/RepB/Spo0J family partition protein [Rickettsiales bacterium]